MSSLGCPKCGRTPVAYYVSTKKWVCKNCKYEWADKKKDESVWEDKWGPQYVVNTDMIKNMLAEMTKKPVKKPPAPKSNKAPAKPAAKPLKKPSPKKKPAPAKKPAKKSPSKKK